VVCVEEGQGTAHSSQGGQGVGGGMCIATDIVWVQSVSGWHTASSYAEMLGAVHAQACGVSGVARLRLCSWQSRCGHGVASSRDHAAGCFAPSCVCVHAQHLLFRGTAAVRSPLCGVLSCNHVLAQIRVSWFDAVPARIACRMASNCGCPAAARPVLAA
jgi:hypothetical protein